MRKLASALPLLLSLASAQEAVIQSDNTRRTINHWSASAPLARAAAQAQGESRNYHWAAFTGIVGPNLQKDMESRGIEILGLGGRPGTLKLYKVRISGEPAAALEYLQAVTGFVNLLPVVRGEKISRGLLEAEGAARTASVFFHRNLGEREMLALLEGRVDAIHRDQDPRILHVTATPARLRALADLEEVSYVREEVKKQPVNDVSRAITKVDALQAGVLNVTSFPPTPEWNRGIAYTGDSIHVGVNEGFDVNHWDFNEQLPGGALKPRVSHGTASIHPDMHGTHVAGIIGGNGWRSELSAGTRYQWRGVAPKTLMSSWGDKGDVNNHSFTNGDDAIYNSSDAYVDDRLSQHLSLQEDWNNVAVWSAANNGGYYPQYGNQRGFFSMLVNAKNPIKVGATNPQSLRTSFSSMGPTRDGRWGPDVVAPGENILSTYAGQNGYTWMSGTSMSGPHVTGITALIMQKYRDNVLRRRTPDVSVRENPMWNSTVKAILIHSATDLVDLTGQSWESNPDFESAGFPNRPTVYTPGPDWATGFGMVNAQKALQFVDTTRFREGVVGAAQTISYTLTVPSGLPNLRVTLAWDDPEYAGVPDQSNAYAVKLVNDLDLEVAPPTGNPWLPWTLSHAPLHNGTVPVDGLDPITPSEILDRPAVRARDGVNNVEVVDIPNPAPGTWTIRVRGQAITVDQSPDAGLNQDFSLVSDLALPAAPAIPDGPDLIVSRLIVSPSVPGIGRPLTFKAEIKNIGNRATPSGAAINVDLKSNNWLFASSLPHTQVLQPGQSVVVSLDQPAPGGSGSAEYQVTFGGWHGFTAVVDPAGAIAERSDRNNTQSGGAAVPSLPEPWQSRDIGYGGFNTGGASIELTSNPVNVWISGYGSDIYGNRDEFHYLYRPLTGNGEIVGQVVNVGGAHEWAKAGLMIREDLTPESRNALVAVTQAHGTTFQHRSAAGGTTATSEVPSDAQGWLRIVRNGNQITGYRSFDGINWVQVGTVTMALPATVYVGYAVTSHDPNALASSWMTLRSLSGGITNAIRGRIYDQAAKPLSGVTVAVSGAGCGTASATTDAEGWYTLSGIAAGSSCTVTPSRSGFTFQPTSASFPNMLMDASADFTGTGTVVPELPAPWVQGAVGAVGQTGSATYATNTAQFTVNGSGADIWGSMDGFHFVHQPFTGDVQITARVMSVQNTDPWAKAGVMIRENISSGGRHASVLVTPSNGVSFQRRTASGGQSASTTHTGIAAPHWVRLLKVGDNIKAYRSADGAAWTLIGEITLAFTGEFRVGLAVTSHNNASLCQAVFGNVSVQSAGVWTSADIGAVGAAGSFVQTGTSYSVKGSGADIWGTADAFQFVYQSWTGDGQFTARVASVQNTDPWAKAGIMVRESTAPGARHALMAVTYANGTAFQRRTATGGQSEHTGIAGAAPRWVRLVRAGSNVKGYHSADGSSWTLAGETTIAFGAQVLVGMAVTSHNNTVLNTSVLDGVSLAPVTAPVFTATDVGGSVPAGSTTVNNGTYTVNGGGADIWTSADQFHFYHRSMSGDGSITARVVSLTNTNTWAKAGVMIREGLGDGARHVYTGLTPAQGAEFLRRTIVNDLTAGTASAATAPYWVRLTRVGNVFTSSVSANGTTWTQVGTATIAMAADVRVGFAVCSHNTAALLTGVFDNVTIVE